MAAGSAVPAQAVPATLPAATRAHLTVTLRKGNSHHAQNRILLRRLNALGATLAVDGIVGPRTRASLKLTPPAGAVTPASRSTSRTAINLARSAMWDGIARCESGGRWNISTGNGYYGGLQPWGCRHAA